MLLFSLTSALYTFKRAIRCNELIYLHVPYTFYRGKYSVIVKNSVEKEEI